MNVSSRIKYRAPNFYFAEPASDSLTGYIGGVGPFYTKTDFDHSFEDTDHNKVKFVRSDETIKYSFPKNPVDPRRRNFNILQTSPWIYLTIFCLFASSVLVYISFLSNGWGEVGRGVAGDKYSVVTWRFGLWMSCRDDGVCLGLKWPVFYGICRAFYILTLFSNTMSLAWLLGHHFEKLMKFDICTMATLAALCICSGIFSLITVTSFGVYWRDYMITTFSDQIVFINVQYAFYIAVATVPLSFISAIFLIIDLKGPWKVKELEKHLQNH